jgi:preprotein translocase subunit SecB
MAESNARPTYGDEPNTILLPQKLYIKDVSFETPNSPRIFLTAWEPANTIDISQRFADLGDDAYEVVLTLTTTMKCGDTTAYLAEIQQAGIFTIKGFDEKKLDHILNVYCARVLYPYACSATTELVARGGFPQLILAPLSFDAIYRHRQNEAESAGAPD